jgi:hypothetical protein
MGHMKHFGVNVFFRLSYYRFASLRQGMVPSVVQPWSGSSGLTLGTGKRAVGGFDRVRASEIGKKDIQLQNVRCVIRATVSFTF